MAKSPVRHNQRIAPVWITAAQDVFFSVLSSLLVILALRLISEPIYLFVKIVLIWVGVSAVATFIGIQITKCHKTVRRYTNYKAFLRVLGALAINPRYHYLCQIRPGVTSYATLYNGYTDTLEKMLTRLDLDLYYLRNRSVWFDMRIMVLTALNVAAGKKI